ncbi:MAG: acetylornithine deacetylase [Pseudomonadales bacterium]|nr:acetylornithine deacetylase [Pseudomonadales bacterium]NRA16830.1 acetylornithine deacetylase [Oceanospirillaceae bacterium]
MSNIKNILAKLISFDTVSRHSNLALIDYVQSYLTDLGIESRLVPNQEQTKTNLYATIGPNVAGGIILSGHTDVVPVDGQDWHTDPFTLVEKDQKYFGRGSCDMKGFLAICLAAVPAMLEANLKRPIHLCFSYDEEIGCVGAVDLVAEIAVNLPPVEAVFVGEPTSMQVANLHKSVNSMLTKITGVEAHSSKLNLGVSANFAAAKLINFLSDALDEYRANPQTDLTSLEPNYSTLNIGTIHGGNATNIIPKFCEFSTDLRTVPKDDPDICVHSYKQYTQKIAAQMQAQNPICSIEVIDKAAAPGLAPEENGVAESLALQWSANQQAIAVAYGTEAGLFQKAGYSTIVCGPGSIDQAHKPNEFIEIAQLEKCAVFIEKLIQHSAN